MSIEKKIIQTVLPRLNSLLVDERQPGGDPTRYAESQFALLFPNARNAQGDIQEADYPLTPMERADLQKARVLRAVRIGFVPIANLNDEDMPSLFIANATDSYPIDLEVTGNQYKGRVYPLNMRLVLKQPDAATIDTSNLVVSSQIFEGLQWALDFSVFFNLTYKRPGYTFPTTVRDIEYIDGQNLEELATPFEVIDYRWEFSILEQKSLLANPE